MTSRKVSRRRWEDPLDATIRWVLQQRLGDATPPPGVWERIHVRLVQQTSVEDAAGQQGFRLAVKTVVLWLLTVSAIGARTELPYAGLGAGNAWQGNPFYLADQYGILLRALTVL